MRMPPSQSIFKQFPVFFGTNRKRDTSQKRIAFGNERNLDELTLGVVKVVVPPPAAPPSKDSGADRKRQGVEAHISDARQLAIQPANLTETDALARIARDPFIGGQDLPGAGAVVRAWLQRLL